MPCRSLLCWTVVAGLTAAVAASTAPWAAAQLPVPVPTATPPPLPDPLPLPDVPDLPALPALPTPSVPAPDVPDVPDAPALPGVTSPSGGGSDSGTAPRASSPSGGSTTSGGGSGGGSATGSAPGRRTPAARTRARAAGQPPAPTKRHERRLRRTVEQLSGCLDVIATPRRRVLVLRAGVGPRSPQTRHAVARRLDTTVRRVARAERRGLRALRRAARAGRCGGAAPGTTTPFAGRPDGSGPVTMAAIASGTGAEPGSDGGAATGGSGVKDEFRTSGPPDTPGALAPRGDDSIGAAPVLLLLAAAFLAGFAAVWTLDRHRQHGGHAA